MSRKRLADWEIPSASPSPKRQRFASKPTASLPRKRYPKHRDSKVGEDFHSVPYPLSLLPKASWQALNQGESDGICSSCGKARQASAHQRKLFLVAERLSWEEGTVGYSARSQNEEALWACNAELGIFEPAVEDEETVTGGRRSRDDPLYPYKLEEEVELAMRLIASAEVLTEASWTLWKGMVGKMLKLLKETPAEGVPLDDVPLNIVQCSPRRSPRKNGKQALPPLPTPPSSNMEQSAKSLPEGPLIRSFSSLQDFYSLMDKIERTSPMGTRFLEAYADRLHKETCESCWFVGIASDDEDDTMAALRSSPQASPMQRMPPGQVAHDARRYGNIQTAARSNARGMNEWLPGEMR